MDKKTAHILRRLRLNRNLTQENFAKRLGVSANYVSLIENQQKEPGRNFLRHVSKTFKIPFLLLAQNEYLPKPSTNAEKILNADFQMLLRDLEKYWLKDA